MEKSLQKTPAHLPLEPTMSFMNSSLRKLEALIEVKMSYVFK
jgi:hypothetical protein